MRGTNNFHFPAGLDPCYPLLSISGHVLIGILRLPSHTARCLPLAFALVLVFDVLHHLEDIRTWNHAGAGITLHFQHAVRTPTIRRQIIARKTHPHPAHLPRRLLAFLTLDRVAHIHGHHHHLGCHCHLRASTRLAQLYRPHSAYRELSKIVGVEITSRFLSFIYISMHHVILFILPPGYHAPRASSIASRSRLTASSISASSTVLNDARTYPVFLPFGWNAIPGNAITPFSNALLRITLSESSSPGGPTSSLNLQYSH